MTLLISFPISRSFTSKGLAAVACTRSGRRICIPKTLCGEPFPVSTRQVFTIRWRFHAGAVRFLLWWLSSTAGYVPGNEARVFRLERLGTFRLIISLRRYPFLSGQLRPICRPTFASLSASAPSVLGSGFPLLLPASSVSPHPLHLSVPVKIPVSNLDCDAILHPKNRKSSRKHFNFRPYSTDLLCKSCGKGCAENVDEMWQIKQPICRQELTALR